MVYAPSMAMLVYIIAKPLLCILHNTELQIVLSDTIALRSKCIHTNMYADGAIYP